MRIDRHKVLPGWRNAVAYLWWRCAFLFMTVRGICTDRKLFRDWWSGDHLLLVPSWDDDMELSFACVIAMADALGHDTEDLVRELETRFNETEGGKRC